MDLYQTDTTFQPLAVIDNYESLVWTDRYEANGDFELVIPYTADLASELKNYKYLVQSESDRVMMIETVGTPEEKSTLDKIKISGRSLEAFLNFRDNTLDDDLDSVVIEDTPGAIINSFVYDTCIDNILPLGTQWNIPGLVLGTPPAGTSRILTVPRGKIYPMIQAIASANGLGFKMYRTSVPGEIIFQVYAGTDRSTGSLYTEFAPDTDSLINVSSLNSIANYETDLRVYGAKTWAGAGFAPLGRVGWDRKYAVIIAHDIGPDSTTTYTEDQQAIQYRIGEIIKSDEHKYVNLVEGELPQGIPHTLGDILWVKNTYGVKNKVRITEKIWTSDATGTKRIPTFEAL